MPPVDDASYSIGYLESPVNLYMHGSLTLTQNKPCTQRKLIHKCHWLRWNQYWGPSCFVKAALTTHCVAMWFKAFE